MISRALLRLGMSVGGSGGDGGDWLQGARGLGVLVRKREVHVRGFTAVHCLPPRSIGTQSGGYGMSTSLPHAFKLHTLPRLLAVSSSAPSHPE